MEYILKVITLGAYQHYIFRKEHERQLKEQLTILEARKELFFSLFKKSPT